MELGGVGPLFVAVCVAAVALLTRNILFSQVVRTYPPASVHSVSAATSLGPPSEHLA